MSEEHLYAVITCALNGMRDPHWIAKVREAVEAAQQIDPFAETRVSVTVAQPVKKTWRDELLPLLKRLVCDTQGDSPENWYGILRDCGIQKGEGGDALIYLVDRARRDNPKARFPSQCLPYKEDLRTYLRKRRGE